MNILGFTLILICISTWEGGKAYVGPNCDKIYSLLASGELKNHSNGQQYTQQYATNWFDKCKEIEARETQRELDAQKAKAWEERRIFENERAQKAMLKQRILDHVNETENSAKLFVNELTLDAVRSANLTAEERILNHTISTNRKSRDYLMTHIILIAEEAERRIRQEKCQARLDANKRIAEFKLETAKKIRKDAKTCVLILFGITLIVMMVWLLGAILIRAYQRSRTHAIGDYELPEFNEILPNQVRNYFVIPFFFQKQLSIQT